MFVFEAVPKALPELNNYVAMTTVTRCVEAVDLQHGDCWFDPTDDGLT